VLLAEVVEVAVI